MCRLRGMRNTTIITQALGTWCSSLQVIGKKHRYTESLGYLYAGCVGNYIFSTQATPTPSNMGTFHLFGGLLLVAGLLVLQTAAQDEPEVTLPGTTLRGNYYHFNETEYLNVDIIIEEFLGIPFAKPPEGDLRFRKPVLPDPLGSTYNAKRDKPICAQLSSVISPDEDCLYLGVFTSSPRVRS